MGMFKRLAEEASEKVLDFFINLSKRKDVFMSPQQMEKEAGERARKLAMEAPEVFGYYEDIPLMQTLMESPKNPDRVKGLIESDAVLAKPKTFGELAAPIRMEHPDIVEGVEKTVSDYRDKFRSGQKVDSIPYLDYEIKQGPDQNKYMQIVGHDGRHRNRALQSLGNPSSLIRMYEKGGGVPRMRSLDPSMEVYSEKSLLNNQEPRFIGTLGDLFKVLGISAAVAPGALSSLGGKDGS
jgi:hypothetical protein